MSLDQNNWLGMGALLNPLAPVSFSLFCDSENEAVAIFLQDQTGQVSTVVEVVAVSGIELEQKLSKDVVDTIILHPFLSECLLHIASTLLLQDNDGKDNSSNKTTKYTIPLQINCPMPTTTAATTTPLPPTKSLLFYANRIESVLYPHPKFYNHISNVSLVSETNFYHDQLSIWLRCDYFDQVSKGKNKQLLEPILISYVKQALVHRLLISDIIILLPIPYSCLHEINNINSKRNNNTGINSANSHDVITISSSHVETAAQDEILHVLVENISPATKTSCNIEQQQCYCVGPIESFRVILLVSDNHDDEAIVSDGIGKENDSNNVMDDDLCPGYAALLNDLVQLATLWDKRVSSPILLTGCAGVGKTKMASALITMLSEKKMPYLLKSHRVNIRDLLSFMVSSSSVVTDDALLNYLLPSSLLNDIRDSSSPCWLVFIVDDIDFIVTDGYDGNNNDSFGEENDENNYYSNNNNRISQASIMNALSKFINLMMNNNAFYLGSSSASARLPPPPPFILGLSRLSMARLPNELSRVGLFDKEIVMQSPNQSQRQDILQFWLKQLPIIDTDDKDNTIHRWTRALSSQLAGCVASDIRRICADALMSATARSSVAFKDKDDDYFKTPAAALLASAKVIWPDIRDAARHCIPSQLAALDVTSPHALLFGDDNIDGEVDAATIISDLDKNMNVRGDEIRRHHDKSWKYFGGYQEVKDRVFRTIVGPWQRHLSEQQSTYNNFLEITPPSGVLFHGLSGVGKTFAAECLASSLGLNVIKIRASDVLNKWLGGSEAAIRSIFARARSAAPCTLFFDDIDALASNREQDDENIHSRILSTLLNEMDGISCNATKGEVLVICATDRLDSIDAALLRPGRLGEHVHLQMPTAADCKEIFKVHTRNLPLGADVNLDHVGNMLYESGVATGAKIEGLCREACLNALRKDQDDDNVEVTLLDLTSIIGDF